MNVTCDWCTSYLTGPAPRAVRQFCSEDCRRAHADDAERGRQRRRAELDEQQRRAAA